MKVDIVRHITKKVRTCYRGFRILKNGGIQVLQNSKKKLETLKDLLGLVDFNLLRNIFTGYLEKSGVHGSQLNDVAVDSIVLRPPQGRLLAAYDSLLNRIFFCESPHFKKIHLLRKRFGYIPEGFRSWFLLVLIHELCHAFGYVRASSETNNQGETMQANEAGYHSIYGRMKEEPQKHDVLKGFNEGVTQRIAEEVAVEYAKRSGQNKLTEHIAHSIAKQDPFEYFLFMNQVDSIAKKVDHDTGVESGTTWKSIIRGYFANPRLNETKAYLDQLMGEGFFEKLEGLQPETHVKKIATFDAKYNMHNFHSYKERRLEELGIQVRKK